MYRRLLAQGGNAFDNQIRGEAAARENESEAWGEIQRQEEAIREKMREMNKPGYRKRLEELNFNNEADRAEYESLRIDRLLAMKMGI